MPWSSSGSTISTTTLKPFVGTNMHLGELNVANLLLFMRDLPCITLIAAYERFLRNMCYHLHTGFVR